MNRKLRIKALILFSIILISINFSTSFSQKKEVNRSSRIEGIVSAVEGNILEISRGAIKIDITKTEIIKRRENIKSELLKSSIYVQIYDDELNNNRAFLRKSIQIIGLLQNEAQITGEVLDIDYKTKKVRILNQEIEVSEETKIQIFEKNVEINSFSKLKPNKFARVLLSKEGEKLLAKEIYQDSNLTPAYILGQIEEVKGESVKILNNFYINTNNVDIKSVLEGGQNCKDIEVSALEKGMLIRLSIDPNNIEYNIDGSTSYNVKGENNGINRLDVYLEDEGVIEGIVEEINIDKLKIRIASQEVIVDTNTIIDKNRQQILFSNISAKQRVLLIYKVIEGELKAKYISLIEEGSNVYATNPCGYN